MRNSLKTLLLGSSLMWGACESAEDISFGFDHQVPNVMFESDSLTVPAGETLALQIELTDNAGLASWEVSCPKWGFRKFDKIDGVKHFTLPVSLPVPENAAREWEEVKYRNDGSSYVAIENYHKVAVVAYDVNQNKRTSYLYVRIK